MHILRAHVPYRSWCADCVAGRGKTCYHEQDKKDREGETPVVSIDDGFFGEKADNQEEAAKLTFQQ